MKKLLFPAALLIATCILFSAQKGQVLVHVKGCEKMKGVIRAALFESEKGFPTKFNLAYAKKAVKVKKSSVRISFNDIPHGSYAIALYHDENSNKKIDQNFIGMPTEGFGFSNDATGTIGPPDYEDCEFRHNKEKTILTINMNY